jgi:flagellum-specific peptidoglycan hydrolase FlgJ
MCLILAQAAQESGWGTSKQSTQNCNYFGVRRKDKYERYSCQFESFVDYGAFVMGAECYRGCENLGDWLIALECCGYAGDKHYTKRLLRIIDKYNLYTI